jgi:MFS superfamily sulfate permease-like transporter
MLITLMTDLLVGVAAGLVLKMALHLKYGTPPGSLFKTIVTERREGSHLTREVYDAATFTNFLGLRNRLAHLNKDVQTVTLDFENTWVVDHTVLENPATA